MVNSSEEVLITGLWKTKKKTGEDYLKGTLGVSNILIFKNTQKRNEKSPDYNIVIAENKKPEHRGKSSKPQYNPGYSNDYSGFDDEFEANDGLDAQGYGEEEVEDESPSLGFQSDNDGGSEEESEDENEQEVSF